MPPKRVGLSQDFGRTFLISLVVTLSCLVIGYPLAYWLSTMPERRANCS